MKKEFVTYEIALELKELGFDEPCLAFFEINNTHQPQNLRYFLKTAVNREYIENTKILKYIYGENSLLAPLYQQAFRWFREKYGLIGYIQTSYITNEVVNNKNIPCTPRIEFTFGITNAIGKSIFSSFKQGSFKTYEEAELEGLKKLIENFKQK